MVKSLKKIIRALSKTASALIYYSITYLIPKDKDLWVFGSWKGRNYSDNSKVLFEYVCKHKYNVRAVWIAKNEKVYDYVKKLGYPVVKYNSFKSKLLVARAAINVQTESNEDTGRFRVGRTKVIQLFHGAGGVKEPFVYGGMSPLKKALVKIYADNHSTSYWMVGSEYFFNRYPTLYECNQDLIRITGSPRTDMLLANRKINYFENFKKRNPSGKIIAYTPTHRNFAQNANLYLHEDFWQKLNEFLKENNYTLFFKPHPLELHKYLGKFEKYDNIILVTDSTIEETSDFNEYMHYFDMLISDYSSISTDFLLFDRPVIHYMYDMDSFEDTFFKLNALDKFLAGPIVKTLEDLMIKIHEGLNEDRYKDYRKKAIKNAYKYIDTNNCQRIYTEIIKILNAK